MSKHRLISLLWLALVLVFFFGNTACSDPKSKERIIAILESEIKESEKIKAVVAEFKTIEAKDGIKTTLLRELILNASSNSYILYDALQATDSEFSVKTYNNLLIGKPELSYENRFDIAFRLSELTKNNDNNLILNSLEREKHFEIKILIASSFICSHKIRVQDMATAWSIELENLIKKDVHETQFDVQKALLNRKQLNRLLLNIGTQKSLEVFLFSLKDYALDYAPSWLLNDGFDMMKQLKCKEDTWPFLEEMLMNDYYEFMKKVVTDGKHEEIVRIYALEAMAVLYYERYNSEMKKITDNLLIEFSDEEFFVGKIKNVAEILKSQKSSINCLKLIKCS